MIDCNYPEGLLLFISAHEEELENARGDLQYLEKIYKHLIEKVLEDDICKIRMIPKPQLQTLCRVVAHHRLPVPNNFADAMLLALLESNISGYRSLLVSIFAQAPTKTLADALTIGFSMP